MAIFYLAVQSVRRGDGRSAVAAAAYRAGEKLDDERTGETFNYTRRRGVVASGVIGWQGDRASLWNAAEAAENRKNSVVAREIVIALPCELDDVRRAELVKSFAHWLHSRHGVAVDYAIHSPDKDGDQRNHHAHLMVTTRKIEGGCMRAKTRELDQKQHSRKHIEAWRSEWAAICNRALALGGADTALDHRSYLRQAEPFGAVPLEPQKHLGPSEARLNRKGRMTAKAKKNAWARAVNKGLHQTGRHFGRGLVKGVNAMIDVVGKEAGRER